jgi:hypothetical protein
MTTFLLRDEHCALDAERLSKAQQNGDLAAAYAVFKNKTPREAKAIALRAGLWVNASLDKDFWPSLQARVANACRASKKKLILEKVK